MLSDVLQTDADEIRQRINADLLQRNTIETEMIM